MAAQYSNNKLILKAMMILDNFSCCYSDLVVTGGRDLVETLKSRFKNSNAPKYTLINYWTDEKEFYPLPGIGVLEKSSEARMLIEKIGCSKCCGLGDYV